MAYFNQGANELIGAYAQQQQQAIDDRQKGLDAYAKQKDADAQMSDSISEQIKQATEILQTNNDPKQRAAVIEALKQLQLHAGESSNPILAKRLSVQAQMAQQTPYVPKEAVGSTGGTNAIGGGATGALVQRLMDEQGLSFQDALQQVQTGNRQGIILRGGTAIPQYGYNEALSSKNYAAETGTQTAQVDTAREKAFEAAGGTADAANTESWNQLSAALPAVEETLGKLYDLAEAASYTNIGKFSNAIKRQLGVKVSDAAEARALMINIIDNDVIPSLKQTLGAQFTEKEGQWLKNMYLDANLSPSEKQAQIEAKLGGFYRNIETKARLTGNEPPTRKTAKELSGAVNPADIDAEIEQLKKELGQ